MVDLRYDRIVSLWVRIVARHCFKRFSSSIILALATTSLAVNAAYALPSAGASSTTTASDPSTASDPATASTTGASSSSSCCKEPAPAAPSSSSGSAAGVGSFKRSFLHLLQHARSFNAGSTV